MRRGLLFNILALFLGFAIALFLFFVAPAEPSDMRYYAIVVGMTGPKTMEELVQIQEIMEVALGTDYVVFTQIIPEYEAGGEPSGSQEPSGVTPPDQRNSALLLPEGQESLRY